MRKILKQHTIGKFARFFYSGLLCQTVDFINTRGLIHRDIKPENILLAKEGYLKLADLGIAEIIPNFESQKLKHYGAYSESIDLSHPRHYFSPEQLQRVSGETDVDLTRSDRFQLGKVIHEIFTGRNPVGQLNPRSRIYEGIPPTIFKLISNMLSDEPSQRPSLADCSAVFFAEAVRNLHDEVSIIVRKEKECKKLMHWFKNTDCYDLSRNRENGPIDTILTHMDRAGFIPFDQNTSVDNRGSNIISLSPLGRDVRDMLLNRTSWRQLMNCYKVLKRPPAFMPPEWGGKEWFSFSEEWFYFDPKRNVPVEELSFCQRYKDQWSAWVICPPMQLGSSWWVEIYEGEMPIRILPGHASDKEWLLRYNAPHWIKKGSTVRQVLNAVKSELVKSGISRSQVEKALSKLQSSSSALDFCHSAGYHHASMVEL